MYGYDASTWSVDHLVASLCHSRNLFKDAGCRMETIPDLAALENQLRDNEVDGSTFLALDQNTLKVGLGINNLGQRMALLDVISLLRTRSATHTQRVTTDGVEALSLNAGHEYQIAPSKSTTTIDANGRKRQKVTHVTTAPIPTTRQPMAPGLSALNSPPGYQPTVDGSGEWDYLLRRWQKEDQNAADIDDLAGDMTEDLTEDLTEDMTEDEDEDEENANDISEVAENHPLEHLDHVEETEAIPGRSKLGADQIVDVINERIEHYQGIWFPMKGVAKGDEPNYDPQKIWDDAEATGQRQAMIEKHRKDLLYYGHRLDRLCQEIQDYAGNNLERLRHQCGVLEVTVDSLELSRWLLSIYRLRPGDDSEAEAEAEDEDEDELDTPDSVDKLPTARAQPDFAARHMLLQTGIIDLGSPPESSQEYPDEMIVDSSPPPEDHIGQHHSATSDRFHTPDSVIAQTIEPPAMAPSQLVNLSEPPVIRAKPQQQQQHSDEPQNASFASARRWRWADLRDQNDNKRCVTKAVQEMTTNDRETIRARLNTVGKVDMIREIPACLQMLARNETRMQGVLARDLPKILTFTRLFLCWWHHDNYFRLEPSEWQIAELQRCLEDGSPDPSTFYDYLNTIMRTTFNPEALLLPEQPSQAEIVEISSDEDEPAPKPATQRTNRTQRPKPSQLPVTITID